MTGTAREVLGADAEAIWAHARRLYHGFETYPAMTGGRAIRVFRLEPTA